MEIWIICTAELSSFEKSDMSHPKYDVESCQDYHEHPHSESNSWYRQQYHLPGQMLHQMLCQHLLLHWHLLTTDQFSSRSRGESQSLSTPQCSATTNIMVTIHHQHHNSFINTFLINQLFLFLKSIILIIKHLIFNI